MFNEIDQDGSGSIDKTEFRQLLKALKLTYSDQRFKRLYRAVDSDGDNNIGIDEIDQLLNPKVKPAPPAVPPSSVSTPSGSEKVNQNQSNEGDAPFESPIKRRGSQPAKAAERLRSLSSISDYPDTDSDEEGGGDRARKQKQLDSLNNSLNNTNNSLNNTNNSGNNQNSRNQHNREADGKVTPFLAEDEMDKPVPEEMV